jgi:mono/diheme cytochrome c family protein
LLVLLLAGGGATAYLGGMFAFRQEVPLEPEAAVADLGKRWLMVPAEFTDWRMPEPRDVARGKQLYDVECSLCHGAGARGDAALGRQMFPPAVDLTRDRTQTKTDGQLYWLIAHGLNYTGMPGWGREFCTTDERGKQYCGPNDQNEIWDMVAYLRSLRGSQ